MLRSSSYRHRLWLLVGGAIIFLSIVAGTEIFRRRLAPPVATSGNNAFALDFIAFYTGGTFVSEGRYRELFDLKSIQQFQRTLAAEGGVDLGTAMGPWWNPPFYAWVFAPLSHFSFGVATTLWVSLNILCAAMACFLLVKMLPGGIGWRSWLLVPVLLLFSTPFIHAITHGQNACMSLLIVTVVVTAWRSKRGFVAGLVAGLMFYKPQHAVALGAMLALSLGWRALAGLAITGFSLLMVTVLTLPGSLSDFLHQMPKNLQFVQEQCVYPWERHVTLKAFFRILLQGLEVGPSSELTLVLTALGTAAVAIALLRMTPVARWLNPFDRTDFSSTAQRDRLIAATFLATPLLMPFYFDYDLLLLAVPGVLFAGLMIRDGKMIDGGKIDRAIRVVGPLLYAELMTNADFSERTHINLAVPLLAAILGLSVVPSLKRKKAATSKPADFQASPFAQAA